LKGHELINSCVKGVVEGSPECGEGRLGEDDETGR
jgi:hypothetical protein